MERKMLLAFSLSAFVFAFSCKEKEEEKAKPILDIEKESKEYYDPKDSNVLKAYLNDKSIITSKDIDPADTVYATKSKILYQKGTDHIAVVFGFKADIKAPGIALLQKNEEKPIKLPQIDSDESGNPRFSDGKYTLTRDADYIYLSDKVTSEQYERVK